MRIAIAGILISMVVQAQIGSLPPGPGLRSRNIPPATLETLIVRQVAPEYPSEAQRLGIVGDVWLTVQMDPKGRLQKIKVVRGPAALREAAVNAVKQWTFRPYHDLFGVAVSVQSQIVIHFPPLPPQ